LGITRVIRLNEARYDSREFTENGIAHNCLEFTDGSTPPMDVVNTFFDIVDK